MRARTITITIAIGVAAAGVMALGAQTATALPTYETRLWMQHDGADYGVEWGYVESQLGSCERRRVVLFQRLPGADRRLLSTRTKGPVHISPRTHRGHRHWLVQDRRIERVLQPDELQPGDAYYGKVMPKRRPGFVCRADRSNRVLTW